MKKLALAILLLFSGFVHAGPEDAVVCIPSHGGSGTIIGTGQGWTYILTCWHCFDSQKAQKKPIIVDMPKAWLSMHQRVGISLIALGDSNEDLAVIKVNYGPVPNVLRVPSPGYRPTQECLSIGFDSMQYPAQVKSAKIMKAEGYLYWTDSRPWHGRSGGALVERNTSYLIGVCHAYTGPSNHREYSQGDSGLYINHKTVANFLIRNRIMNPGTTQEEAPRQFEAPRPQPQLRGPGC